ncbi:transglutaminase domain-containing protein [Clostridium ihumii]|uniref:transglutaminase domain-containing protein n=1 Tax=Clostridium ihumii TaxID=1470356 RepID=UPI000550E696|nr:transglutaminase domain-containing protein [Clostridium ihumii]
MKKYILNNDYKEQFKNKIVTIILVFLNIIVPLEIIIKAYNVEKISYNYSIIFSSIFKWVMLAFFVYFLNEIAKKIKCKLGIILAMLIAGAIYSYRNYEVVIAFITNEIVKKTPRLFNLIYKNKPIDYIEYKIVIAIFIVGIVLILLYLTNKIKKIILVLSFSFIIAFWYLYTKTVIMYLDLYFFFFIISICLINYMDMAKKYKKEKIDINLSIKNTMIFTTVISVVMIYSISTLPKEYEAINTDIYISKVKNKFGVNNIENIKENALNGTYSIKSSGYTNSDKELGGPIQLKNDDVFNVDTDIPCYLKGNIKYTYDGKRWLKSKNIDELISINENKQYENNSLNKGDYLSDYKNIKNIKISHNNSFKTNTFFVPEKAINILGATGDVYHSEGDTYLSNENIKKQYTIMYNVPENIRNTIKTEGYEGLYSYIKNNNKGNAYNFITRKSSDEEIIAYDEKDENKIRCNAIVLRDYEKYLQLPIILSENVYELVNDITQFENTTIGKATAISKYLKNNYPYSLDVSKIPEDDEFLNYFLFKEKKGYCTYFATATSVMCRIAGIPSRYVEGFKISKDKKDGIDHYTVTNGEAHAWCEILINPEKDIWIPLDPSPTPTEWKKENKIEEEKKEESKYEENNIISPRKNHQNINQFEEDDDDSYFYNLNYEKIFKRVSIIFTIVLYIIIKVVLYYVRKNKMLKSDSIIPLYNYYINRLETLGITKNRSSTDLEFLDEIRNSELKKRLKELIELSYKEYYGQINIGNIDKKSYIIFIENYVRQRQSIFKYLMKKYLVTL